jgi:hypothetical protein
MSNTHEEFHFSITIHTDDLAVLGCLRSLSQHAQATGNARIPWGGTKRGDWQRANHHATFHFSSNDYREEFLRQAQRLLPGELWRVVRPSDDDPAVPRNSH